ncbi:MAG: hypothetical protein AABY15_08530 [Nanoarchaeota archaeon]
MENKKINLDLVGLNGNAFVILGAFRKQAQKENWSEEEIEAVMNEAQNDDYNHLLQTIMAHTK